jgi:hypothetical protein
MEFSYGFRTAEELRCGVGINCGGTELRLQEMQRNWGSASETADNQTKVSETADNQTKVSETAEEFSHWFKTAIEFSYGGFKTAEDLFCGFGINCGGTKLQLQEMQRNWATALETTEKQN